MLCFLIEQCDIFLDIDFLLTLPKATYAIVITWSVVRFRRPSAAIVAS
jgi:hypothetical protein